MKKFLALALLAIGLLSFQRISADGAVEPPTILRFPLSHIVVSDGSPAFFEFQYAPAYAATSFELYERGQRVTDVRLRSLNATITISQGVYRLTMNPAKEGVYEFAVKVSNVSGMVHVNTVIEVVKFD